MATAGLEEKKKEKWSSYIRGLVTSSPSPAADEYASATADNESGPPRPQEESLQKAVDDEEAESEETEEYYVDPGKHEYMKVFACSDSEQLASEICANLATTEGRVYTGKFADGEVIVDIVDEVRGQDCFIIQQFPISKKSGVSRIEGRDCIIVDDIIDSGKRMSRTVEELRQHGARRIYMYATHGVLSPAAMERINRRGVTEVVITNSLPFPEQARKCEKIRVLSLGQVLAEVMLQIYEQKSVSQMFWVSTGRENLEVVMDNQKKEGSKRPSGTATV
ncbi:ribose-phosphate pyrophosphokinase, putative [Perkinsus marinus ATCC 50983]|uniref:Ribose-phosphate pyrophosphokinase, putative n=1 Tax=Perkinsus marinus (strain ATCC 50983 / TXsc) TaxID=423536 RepID=C5KFS4_PERM5|nr:ribose-phosphate pyrophosphokinase, putative [Perkinsus marinus ATCC 50983]EER16672.1 ribose-phosphate pyrophosphokinase, putative [Perkinsus marinus ATCC 50983]|eukprot:XP_002784876.1 ribose-phosphate pyrophosphokinase, putative [Perkinsus marinus ATCC 50983]